MTSSPILNRWSCWPVRVVWSKSNPAKHNIWLLVRWHRPGRVHHQIVSECFYQSHWRNLGTLSTSGTTACQCASICRAYYQKDPSWRTKCYRAQRHWCRTLKRTLRRRQESPRGSSHKTLHTLLSQGTQTALCSNRKEFKHSYDDLLESWKAGVSRDPETRSLPSFRTFDSAGTGKADMKEKSSMLRKFMTFGKGMTLRELAKYYRYRVLANWRSNH